ncbi:MAG: VOC family protein [Candidatus Gastranaerophilales bacterium]|nr:VOC family protein [Candidatus Gastranaerophilales bacterium]
MKFLHAMIRVNDIKKSLDFYMKVLGLKPVSELRLDDCTLYYLQNEEGQVQLELTHNDTIPEKGYQNGNAFGHFAFETESMDEFSKRLQKYGLKYTCKPFMLGVIKSQIAFLKDPDGNEIEIIEKVK